MIAEVYFWTVEAKVTVFDELGRPMPYYCGPHREVASRILQDAPRTARLYQASLAVGSKEPITREQFLNA
jgi:hypothetical protein